MTSTVTLRQLHLRGVVPAPHEAVALVLALVESGTATHDATGASIPYAAEIHLSWDGVVSCRDAFRLSRPPEIATLLQHVLGDTRGIPPGLLYCIARAQRRVEAPPFDSVDAFLRSLARFERGDRRAVLAALAARFATAPPARSSRPERRAVPSVVAQLRRELRAMDRRRYEEDKVEVRVTTALERSGGRRVRHHRRERMLMLAAGLVCGAATAGAVSVAVDATSVRVPAIAPPPLDVAPAFDDHGWRPAAAPDATFLLTSVALDGPSVDGAAQSRSHHADNRNARAAKKHSKLGTVFRFGWLQRVLKR